MEDVTLAFVPAISDPRGENHTPVSDTLFNNKMM